MRRWILLSFLLIILTPLVFAEVQSLPQPVKTNGCATLPQSYGNSTQQNVTTIQLPNQTIIIINVSMTSLGGGYFYYQYCNNSLNGNYIVNGIGIVDGVPTTWNYLYIVNPLARVLTIEQAIMYVVLFIGSLFLFFIMVGSALYIDPSNKRDQVTGYIISINNLKYLRILLFCFAYLFLVVMFYFGYIVSYGFLDIDFLGGLCYFLFVASVVLIIPLFIVGVYVFFANMVRDSQLADMLSRGLRTR